jgi:hypothetical protein
MIPYMVRSQYGMVDEDLILWLKAQIEDVDKDVQSQDFIDLYKKMATPTMGSNLMNFSILDNNLLAKILEIKFQINVFNEEVESVNNYLRMTFDSNITNTNHRTVVQEIKNKNLLIAEKSILIVDKINNIIKTKI